MGSDALQRLYSPLRNFGPWDKSLWAYHISFACIPASISLIQPSLQQSVSDLSSMEVLQTKMWMAMPLRPRGSPAPHKVCSPCGQTPGLGSVRQSGCAAPSCFIPSLCCVSANCLATFCFSQVCSWLFFEILSPGTPTYAHKVQLVLGGFRYFKGLPSQLGCSKQKAKREHGGYKVNNGNSKGSSLLPLPIALYLLRKLLFPLCLA